MKKEENNMDIIKLTEEIVLSIVEDKDMVAVKQFESEDENEIIIQVLVAEKDLPKVIGKNGKVINSIKTIAQASSYVQENKLVKINIDSI